MTTKTFTSDLISDRCAYVWAPDGTIFALLDDADAEKPRSRTRLAKDAAFVAEALNLRAKFGGVI